MHVYLVHVNDVDDIELFVRALFESDIKKLTLQHLSIEVCQAMEQYSLQPKADSVTIWVHSLGDGESFLHHCMPQWRKLKELVHLVTESWYLSNVSRQF